MSTNFSIRHFGIVVKNLDESLSFYKDLLEFTIFKEMNESGVEISNFLGIKNVKVKTVKMKNISGQMIELLYYDDNDLHDNTIKINQIGPTHLALSVNDLDATYNIFLKRQIKFISPPQITADKFAKVAFCIAPEGTFIELVQELKVSN
jgi:catechol 2,3-dioxygenase-like lactoylglutathione lyase family enzyme